MFIENKNVSEDNLQWNDFLSGNEEAYCLIYEKYSKKLFIQGLQFTSDKELIKDCIHDIFVKIYKNRANLKSPDNIKVYLFVALRNSIITAIKKRKIQFETLDGLPEYNQIDTGNTEDDHIAKENETDKHLLVAKALRILTIRQREAILYRFYENMNIGEISILMDMNYQSVQNLIQRSLKKINHFLKKN
ncbi:RNA polymerase [Bacteroidia bacterium]|nr:RNA polymerase [Bacteroidia bacterium]